MKMWFLLQRPFACVPMSPPYPPAAAWAMLLASCTPCLGSQHHWTRKHANMMQLLLSKISRRANESSFFPPPPSYRDPLERFVNSICRLLSCKLLRCFLRTSLKRNSDPESSHPSWKQEGCSKREQKDLTFPLTPYSAGAIHCWEVADLRLQASGAEKGFRRSR